MSNRATSYSANSGNKVAPEATKWLSMAATNAQRHGKWTAKLHNAFRNESDKGHHGNLIFSATNKEPIDPRQFPCPMATKQALLEVISQRYKDPHFKGKQKPKSHSRIKQYFRNAFAYFEAFRGMLRRIEGKFGSSIVVYFRFIKTLLFINLWLSLFLVGLIGVPVFMSGYSRVAPLGPRYATMNSTRDQTTVDKCTDAYEISTNRTLLKLILDFVSGTGWMEEKQIFYGYYPSDLLSFTAAGSTVWYNVPMAYLAVSGTVVLLGLIFMARKAASEFKQSFIRARFKQNPHVNLIFGSWDYSLCHAEAVELKKKLLHYEFECNLEDERDKDRRATMSPCQKHVLNFKRLCINLLILGLLAGGGTCLYYSHVAASTLHHSSTVVQLFIDFLPSLTMTILYAILVIVFGKLVVWEDYTPPVQVKLTLMRLVFLRLASLMFLCTIIIVDVTNCTGNTNEISPSCGSCLRKELKADQSESSITLTRCWETYFGQNIYKLVLTEFFVVIGFIFLVEFPRNAIATKCGCRLAKVIGRPEFIIHEEVIDLVYAQTLSWLGFFFCPVVPLMTLLKFFIYFYAKSLSLFINCEPPKRAYRGTQISGFFIIVLLISFVIAIVPMGYAIFRLSPSQGCGPFSIYNSMFDVLSLEVYLWPETARQILQFVSSSAFAIPFFFFLSLLIYYYHARASAYAAMVNLLERQVLLDQASDRMLFQHESRSDLRSGPKQPIRRPAPQSLQSPPQQPAQYPGMQLPPPIASQRPPPPPTQP